jgi:hypothetical protein
MEAQSLVNLLTHSSRVAHPSQIDMLVRDFRRILVLTAGIPNATAATLLCPQRQALCAPSLVPGHKHAHPPYPASAGAR